MNFYSLIGFSTLMRAVMRCISIYKLTSMDFKFIDWFQYINERNSLIGFGTLMRGAMRGQSNIYEFQIH